VRLVATSDEQVLLKANAIDVEGMAYSITTTQEPLKDQVPVPFTVHLPTGAEARCDQDAEWCEVETPEGRHRVRFHDYGEIYTIPGLYEHLFYEELQCDSPKTIRRLLSNVIDERGLDAGELVVLDVGAGNGMVGEELSELGATSIVGIDIIEEAAAAAERDRPGVYDDYRVMDLTDPEPGDDAAMAAAGFNCLTTVAALGFGDIPPNAFARAFNYVEDGGLISFNIKDRFTRQADQSGFGRLLHRMHDEGVLEPVVEHRYRHRLAASGDPLHYMAYVSEKTHDVPADWVED
jgi:SAM-dependent methyltransferase